ncbi:O-antigen ligase family protein, partial [Candidatus Peregrinibacteria bacterium]|nr:O-antigen ligase family protein [Candidatus Peregrinibacteria bacterium]
MANAVQMVAVRVVAAVVSNFSGNELKRSLKPMAGLCFFCHNDGMELTLREKVVYWSLSGFFLIALFNPLFKKYDYGAGFPLVLLFAVMMVVFALLFWRERREKAILELAFLGIFGIFIVSSFVFSGTKNIGLSEVMAFLSVILFYLFFGLRRSGWMHKFVGVIKVMTVLAVFLGFVLYFVWPEVRMQGPFFNLFYHSNVWPNAFALYLLMTWPLFLNESRAKVAILALIFAAILLTFSRGALIVLAGQFLLVLLYNLRRINRRKIVIVGLTFLLTAGVFLGANALRAMKYEVVDVEERATFANSESLTSKQERIDFWLGAIKLAGEKPLFGWGPYSFRYAYNPIQKTFLGSADHPHNIFLKIASENGVIALGAFLAFLLVYVWTLAKRFKGLDEEKRNTAYLLFVAIAGAFAHNLIDYNFNFSVNLFLLFFILAYLR